MKRRNIILSLALEALIVFGVWYFFVNDSKSTPSGEALDNSSATTTQQEVEDTVKQKTGENLNDTTNNEQNASSEDSVENTGLELPQDHANQLPITTNHFSISKTADATYHVELYAILNNTSQREQYVDQLKQYKNEAQEYLESAGVNIETATLTYTPNEAQDL